MGQPLSAEQAPWSVRFWALCSGFCNWLSSKNEEAQESPIPVLHITALISKNTVYNDVVWTAETHQVLQHRPRSCWSTDRRAVICTSRVRMKPEAAFDTHTRRAC